MEYRNVSISKLNSYPSPKVPSNVLSEFGNEISNYPEVFERISGCFEFCNQLSRQEDGFISNEEIINRRKYLRAALSEFVSIEEAAKIDFTAPPKIYDLDDPKMHIVKLLRHANIHLSVSQLGKNSKQASWLGTQFEYNVIYSPDVKSSITQTDQSKKYQSSDLNNMIQWIETEQMEWGIGNLIINTAKLYANELLKNIT